jgi:hypothetical protein
MEVHNGKFVIISVVVKFSVSMSRCNKSNTTGATRIAGTAFPYRAHQFTPDFSVVRVARSLVFCVMCADRCLFFFLLPIVLSVLLRLTASDYPFCILKLFLWRKPSCICGILYIKLNGIDMINIITKLGIIQRKDIIYIAECEIKGSG